MSAALVALILVGGCAAQDVSDSPTAPGDVASEAEVSGAAQSAEPDPRAADSCPGVRCVSVAVTGDVLLHPPLVEQAVAAGAASGRDLDFGPMLHAQQPYLEQADLAVCHLETPLAPANGPFQGYPEFSVPPQILDGLVATGYDACTTASNHTLDQGFDGLVRTVDALDAAGLAHDGSARDAAEDATPSIIDTPNGRVGLISVTYGLNTGPPDEPWMVATLDTDAVIAEAERARVAGADLVVVAIHAGTEYETEPNSEQKGAAQVLLASPAVDLVYGHHAHVVQPMEKIDGKWAIYGLGNMVASHETPVDATREGLLVRVTFSEAADGGWSTSDVAWVPSLQDIEAPRAWCSLTAGPTCTSPAAHRTAVQRTTEAVNVYGADTDGAHLWQLN
jgi:hypothetical protein